MISEEVKELVDACRNEQGLTEAEQAIVREAAEEIEKLQCIPPREYREFAELTSKATRIWAEAPAASASPDNGSFFSRWWALRR